MFTHAFFLDKIEGYEPVEGGVQLGGNVWTKSKVVILLGTRIGDNVIICNLSVVKGNITGGGLYGGNLLKKLMPESFFRKKYTREEKLKATSETFLDFFQDVGGKNKRFDLNTKLYKKAGTGIEVIFLLIPRDRFALFTMGSDPNIKKVGGT